MHVLVADDQITSRVMIETALREHGHSVRNCEDGFEAAKLLSAQYAPRIAIISNSLLRLRGLDVCRFLCATGKKGGVYVILVADSVDMELLELCRRAGVDDVVSRAISVPLLHARLDVADRIVEMDTELRRVQSVIQGLAAYESPYDRKIRTLKDANSALLGSARKQDAAAESKPESAASPARRRHVAPETSAVSRNFSSTDGTRSFMDATPASSPSPAPAGGMSLMGPEPDFVQSKAKPAKPAAKPPADKPEEPEPIIVENQEALEKAAQLQSEELADEELIHPFEFDDIILKVYSGMGVTLKTEIPLVPLPEGPWFFSWVGVAMIGRETVWMDVVMAAGEAAAKAVTSELLGHSKVDDSDVCEMFAELQNMVQGSLRRYMEENGHKGLMQLAIPKALRRKETAVMPEGLVPVVESGFSFNGEPINVMLFEHRENETLEDTGKLELFDLVCDPVAKPDGEDPLIISGVVFKEREKEHLVGLGGQTKPFRVVHASPMSKAIGPEKLFV